MASGKPKTGFDKYVQARMQDRDFASAYIEARAEIDAVDGLMRHLARATKSSPRRGVAAKAQPKRSIKAVHL
jgi:hypothetical protein